MKFTTITINEIEHYNKNYIKSYINVVYLKLPCNIIFTLLPYDDVK